MLLFQLIFSAFFASAEPAQIPSLEQMTLEQKVGQMFIFGFPGTKMSPHLEKTLSELKPGAFLLFGRNIKGLSQTAELNARLQRSSLKHSQIPLFLAVDQEGGAVARIQTSPSLPSAYTIGNTNEPTLAFQAGKVTGEMLSLLGFNMNLAPVLDITDEKLQSFVGTRGFSDSPHKISSMGLSFAQGLAQSPIIPIAKHFPGHGPIALDSHLTTPSRQISYKDLNSMDLLPFIQFSNASIPSGIMVAHISFPNIDKSGLPATYSQKLVGDVLGRDLKYKGLIMTDDIEMAGASIYKKIEDRAVAAVRAGNDLIMVGWSPQYQKRAVKGVIAAVKKGEIPLERIHQSVRKILSLKKNLVPSSRQLAEANDVKNSFKKIAYASVFNEIVERYFRHTPGLSQAENKLSKIYVFSQYSSFKNSFRKFIKTPRVHWITKGVGQKELHDNEILVYHLANEKNYLDLRSLSREAKKRTLVVSSSSRSRIEDKTSFLDVIEIHSYHPNLGGFTADAINRHHKRVAKNGSKPSKSL